MWPSARPLLADAHRRIAGDRRGVAAVEFAIILPLMLLMYIGALDVTRGVMASRKVALLSRTVSDLVSQTSGETNASDISTIFAAASSVMAPYDTSSLKITVSAIDIKAKSDKSCCNAFVRWSYTQSSDPANALRPCSTSPNYKPLDLVDPGVASLRTNLPRNLVTVNNDAGFNYAGGGSTYLIVADVSYSYTAFFQQAAAWFNKPLTRTSYMVPRSSTGPVTLASPVNAPSGQSGTVCTVP